MMRLGLIAGLQVRLFFKLGEAQRRFDYVWIDLAPTSGTSFR